MGARSLRYAPLISPDERPQLTPAVLITRPGQPSLHHAEQVIFAVPVPPIPPPAIGSTATTLRIGKNRSAELEEAGSDTPLPPENDPEYPPGDNPVQT